MFKYIFIHNDTGLVSHSITTTVGAPETPEGMTLLDLSEDPREMKDLVENKYYKNGELTDVPPAPAGDRRFYNFNGTEWDFNFTQFEEEARLRRGGALTGSDWTQVPDSPFTAEERKDWGDYRQALRDLFPISTDLRSLDDIPWPTPPGG